jgi:hypothetical protein
MKQVMLEEKEKPKEVHVLTLERTSFVTNSREGEEGRVQSKHQEEQKNSGGGVGQKKE